MYNDETQIIL